MPDASILRHLAHCNRALPEECSWQGFGLVCMGLCAWDYLSACDYLSAWD